MDDKNLIREARLDTAFSISLRSWSIWLPFDEFHKRAEQLMGYSIPEPKLMEIGFWNEMREKLIRKEGESLW